MRCYQDESANLLFPFSVLLPRLTSPGSSNRLIIKDLCDSVSQLRASVPTREGQHTRENRKIISNAMILLYFAKYYFCRCFRYLFPVLLVFKKFKVRMICKKLFKGPFVRHFCHLPRADSEARYTSQEGGVVITISKYFCFCFCYCLYVCFLFPRYGNVSKSTKKSLSLKTILIISSGHLKLCECNPLHSPTKI